MDPRYFVLLLAVCVVGFILLLRVNPPTADKRAVQWAALIAIAFVAFLCAKRLF